MWTHGFLGNDASLMLDVVVVALVLVVPLLAWSIWLVKSRRNYTLHKQLQVFLTAALLLTVTAFEVDMQIVHGGWENVVNKDLASPRMAAEDLSIVRNVLHVHLVFAVTTPILWAVTLVLAFKRFPDPPTPNSHSRLHSKLGWASAADLVLTSITGLAFYYVAFMR